MCIRDRLPTDKADKFWQYPINKEFEPILDPDVSRNAWADNLYKERYVGNPAVENFLIENKGLGDQGDLIYSEAAKGNLDPYIQYQQRLKNEGILPDSAEKVYQVGKDWMDELGFGVTNFDPRDIAFNLIPSFANATASDLVIWFNAAQLTEYGIISGIV